MYHYVLRFHFGMKKKKLRLYSSFRPIFLCHDRIITRFQIFFLFIYMSSDTILYAYV